MFKARQIKELLEANPFKPFRICLSDGKVFEVPNHDAAWVASDFVEIGQEPDAEGFAQFVSRCALLHITRVENLKAA